ncbi:Pkinase-domain-containing protein [Patellaria atrata CBS 101060]|uniref:Pkinase-domain-containing protein n=1 Tax=Patellaria atrata CBS 101060 TaxID=1346257 RepID=A0A9P4S782_9PEZI|nr:Pkinase-domain-containing protein [Patellaria atrata CBS 101060]
MEDENTQVLTQQVLDPRRLGATNSSLNESDISDVICILHPSSPAAFRVVASAAERTPQHVLQNRGLLTFSDDEALEGAEEADTFILAEHSDQPQDLALRFSSRTIKPFLGFCFGRNPNQCDVVLSTMSVKRVSNLHFRIFVTKDGIIMIEDLSTNGTLVDERHLKGKASELPATRMLNQGSVIQIPSANPDETIKFICRMPSREGHEEEFANKFDAYIARRRQVVPQKGKRPTMTSAYSHGMHWNGGDQYNVVGLLGKGAFAIVYQIAHAMDGRLLAAKELEKRRFIKNGQLDQRLDNEMRIMQALSHPNIVQYIDYKDDNNHLYIIMEYVSCGDLQGYLHKHGVLTEEMAKLMARQILNALSYLHAKNITHRDIKPDNILISSYEPFTVKLSDFGLSKVVKNNDTFLKTFCGTLLYCAPEVFPHYDAHVAGRREKRRRSGPNGKPENFHSYSQSVDIWSFAGVLWFSLCGQPPFEGVMDHNGRGMFDKIMDTALDVTPLKDNGVSDSGIGLLRDMLNTNPALRPTERQCLRHQWLYDDVDQRADSPTRGLKMIPEESEAKEAETEAQLSQLSLRDHATGGAEEIDYDSDDFNFLNPRESKRIKPDMLYPRNQIRDQTEATSSADVSFERPRFVVDGDESFTVPSYHPRPNRLFGEIGQSALKNPKALDFHVAQALEPRDSSASADSSHVSRWDAFGGVDTTAASMHEPDVNAHAQNREDFNGSSLLGTLSMVRELNMASPQSAYSPVNEPPTPKTPSSSQNLSFQNGDTSEAVGSLSEEPTPKQPAFSRQINISIPPQPPSIYFDSEDPSTHSPQYDLDVSGQVFTGGEDRTLVDTSGTILLPDTMTAPPGGPIDEVQKVDGIPTLLPQEFRRPRPRLGRVYSTIDSFTTIHLRLEDRITSWGRWPANSHVYPDGNDTRIPKNAFSIYFHAAGIEKVQEEDKDWTSLDGLHTGITTDTKHGIHINGVKLMPEDSKDGKPLYGRLYTGDVITIYQGSRTSAPLRFVCEFYHGEAARARPAGSGFEVKKSSY